MTGSAKQSSSGDGASERKGGLPRRLRSSQWRVNEIGCFDPSRRSARRNGLVDIFLLGGVEAHQGLDRLDQALGIANEVAVDLFRRQVSGDAGKQPGEMQDLAMRAAHGGEAVALPENLGELRIDVALVVALVDDHLLLNHLVRFGDQRGRALRDGVIERIDDRSQPVEFADQRQVIAMQLASGRRGHASCRWCHNPGSGRAAH